MLTFIGTNISALKDFLLSIEGVVFILGKLCFVAALWFALSAGDALRNFESFTLTPPPSPTSEESVGTRKRSSLEDYQVIGTRNLFGEGVDQKAKEQDQEKKPEKAAKLRLVGTNVVSGEQPFAIIEDTDKKAQEVFDLNSKVFDAGTLIKIQQQRVEIKLNSGSTLVLQLEEVEPPKPGQPKAEGEQSQTEFTVKKDELDAELANLPRLLSQARAVPYFRNGQSVGMRLFAIRKDSMYERLGLKNGDILKTINDSSLSDPSQALKLFNTLKEERSIYLTVERNGEELDLRYSIE